MCDFHSVIVSTDGRVFHLPTNSHSSIAAHYGLNNTPEQRQFFECEWDGRGTMPVELVRSREYGHRAVMSHEVPALVQRTAERHYTKLVAILRGEALASETAPFNLPEYSDVAERIESHKRYAAEQERLRVEREEAAAREAEAEALADEIAERYQTAFDCLTCDQIGVLIRQLTEAANGEARDIFADEFTEAEEAAEEKGKEAGYEDGREAGYSDASDELYSWDYVQEEISNAKEEWEQERETSEDDAREEGRIEGFKEGFKAAKDGSTPIPAYINGLPSFLFA